MTIGLFRLKKQGYDFPPYRPPSEAQSLLLRVTRGCPWNRCSFCSMYKEIEFERRSLEEIKTDITRAGKYYSGEVKSVFIGDSNSLVLKPDILIEILEMLYEYFPETERITSYARARTVTKIKEQDLKKIRSAGLTRLHIGLETGNGSILRKIKKGASPEDFIKAGTAVKNSGFELSLYVLLGLGGQKLWKEHALDTAELLNRIDPHFIRIRTLHPQSGSELYEHLKTGNFEKASPMTVLKEQRLLIENLQVSSMYLSDHISNYIHVNGTLTDQKKEMLALIDKNIREFEENREFQKKIKWKDGLKRL